MRLAVCLVLGACAVEPTAQTAQPISGQVKHDRLALIRDTAAQMGLHNAALLGGIAMSETNLAHCWSEATYACMGPDSPSCGGPIIAGAADGPCANQQGGLGMFQFDAGTYADTLAMYGDQILTVEGNTAQAVSFVVDKTKLDIPGVTDWLSAVAWMDGVPLVAGDPTMEQWAQLLACRYNGCCTTSATCTSRANGYRDNAITLYNDMGADFWRTSDRCGVLADPGTIEERSDCYLAAGDPRFWHSDPAGYDYTMTQAGSAPANFALWLVHTGRASRYDVEVHIDGGNAKATYEVAHAGAVDLVPIDQSTVSGWISLGDFDFAGTTDEHILLADNTGTKGDKLVFDTARITPLDGIWADGSKHGSGGGCATSDGGGGFAIVLAWGMLVRRRREYRR